MLLIVVYIGSVVAQDVINGGLYRQVVAQSIINGGLYMQCRGEWKLARVALTMSAGERVVDCGFGVAGDLPVAPTATR